MVLCIAHLVETIIVSQERERFRPPGALVNVESRTWHLYCAGPRSALPPVLLESGLGDSSTNWADMQATLSVERRVCSYDRLGYGWSSPARGERTAANEADELALLLAAAHEDGPFIIVAHSMGGLIAREFAARSPAQVSGLLLIDPTNETTMGDAAPVALVATSLQVAASSVGLTRPFVVAQLDDDAGGHLPRAVRERAGFLYSTDALATSLAELDGASSAIAAVTVPAIVVFADGASAADRAHYAALGEDVRVTTATTTSHYVQYADPEAVVSALSELDEAVQ